MIDANKNVYKGKFVIALAKVGVKLEHAYYRVYNTKMPLSHISGSKHIMIIFISQGMDYL